MTRSGVEGRHHLAELLKTARNVHAAAAHPDPAPDSAAAHDLEVCDRAVGTAEPVNRTIRCADLWTAIASDQLYGLGLLIEDATTVYPLFPILRSVIEHSAAVAWVLDPTADARTRAARAALATLRSEEEACKASARMDSKKSETYKAASKRYRSTQEAIRQEFGALVQEGGKWQVAGVTSPSPTDMVKQFGARWGDERQWGGMYDYLCATANHPSLMAFDYVMHDAATGTTAAGVPADVLHNLIRAAVVPYIKAEEHVLHYLGWDLSPLDEFIDQINDSVLGLVFTPETPPAE